MRNRWLALIGLLVISLGVFFSFSVNAQNTVDSDRIKLILDRADTVTGVRIPGPNGFGHFPTLKVTVGKRAFQECVLWGRAQQPFWAWWFGWGHTEAAKLAKQCAANVLAPIYANRRLAYQEAQKSLYPLPSVPGVISWDNLTGINNQFLLWDLTRAEAKILSNEVDNLYWTIGGNYGDFVIPSAPYPTYFPGNNPAPPLTPQGTPDLPIAG